MPLHVRPYQEMDEASVIALRQECELTRPWNNPKEDINRKLTTQPELFLVGVEGRTVAPTAMIGFDSNRGYGCTISAFCGRIEVLLTERR